MPVVSGENSARFMAEVEAAFSLFKGVCVACYRIIYVFSSSTVTV